MKTDPPEKWTRQDRIQHLLEQWDVIWDGTSASTQPGENLGLRLLPKMANHPSVKELDRTLHQLHDHAPVQYMHLKAHYTAEWRIATRTVRKRRPSGKGYETLEIRRREPIKPRWVRPEKVRHGERFLTDNFHGEVFIPDELWNALHTPIGAAA